MSGDISFREASPHMTHDTVDLLQVHIHYGYMYIAILYLYYTCSFHNDDMLHYNTTAKVG